VNPGNRVVKVALGNPIWRAHGDCDYLGMRGEPAMRPLKVVVTLSESAKFALQPLLSHRAVYPR
jgi:hypothetical protein